VSPESLPEVLPAKRAARRCLPSRGSRGSRFPTFPGTMRREDYPLPVSGRFAGRSLPDTAPASLRSWCPLRAHGLGEAPRPCQGLGAPGPPRREWCTETGGSPKFPSYPSEDMPRSQTPVVSCALASVAPRIVAFRRLQTVGFYLDTAEAILLTTTIHISGLTHAACLLAPSSFVRPLLGWHVEFTPDLLARRESGGNCTDRTHPLGNNNQFHEITLNSKVSGLPWREQALVRRRIGRDARPPASPTAPELC
jgi:hypothetical protein